RVDVLPTGTGGAGKTPPEIVGGDGHRTEVHIAHGFARTHCPPPSGRSSLSVRSHTDFSARRRASSAHHRRTPPAAPADHGPRPSAPPRAPQGPRAHRQRPPPPVRRAPATGPGRHTHPRSGRRPPAASRP